MSKDIYLVSCVSEKELLPLPARLLYVSDWFKKAAQYAAQNADEWFILSAKYHLVHPDQVIEPYNLTLKTMETKARRNWAEQVKKALLPKLSHGDRVVFLAGKNYREYLIEPIIRLGCAVEVPMEGFRIGEQKRWLKKQQEGKQIAPVRRFASIL